MKFYRKLWPLLAVTLIANLASGAIGAYVSMAVQQNDIVWITHILNEHEKRIEILEQQMSGIKTGQVAQQNAR